MKHFYNFKESYLSESFFDDIESDIDNNDEQISNDIINLASSSIIDEIKNIISTIFRDNSYYKNEVNCTYENKILTIIQGNWSTQIKDNINIKLFQKMLGLLKQVGCELIQCNTSITILSKDITQIYEIDFYNIPLSSGVSLSYVKPKNLNIIYKPVKLKNQYRYFVYTNFDHCNFEYQDTIHIETDSIHIENSFNIKNFSFIKSINSEFQLKTSIESTYPICKNYMGLPDGNYKIDIYNEKKDNNIFNKPMTLVGIPENISALKIIGATSPEYIESLVSNFSLEGITQELIPRIEKIEFYKFNKNKSIVVQIGPYKSIPKIKSYKISNKILEYVAKSHDYYIDCYDEQYGPNRIYNPENVNDKLLNSAQKSQAQAERVKDDAKLKLQLLIDYGIKYLTPDSVWYAGSITNKRVLKIISTSPTIIAFVKDNMYSMRPSTWNIQKRLPWNQFFKWYSQQGYTYKNKESGESINDLIIDKAKSDYEKIKEKRKQDRQKDKQKDKQNNIKQKEKTEIKQKINTDISSINNISQVKNNNIEIIEYSDKALAIFGNTYNIKDQIKELGGKFNPRLKYKDDQKKPGWIISKKKQKEIEELINN